MADDSIDRNLGVSRRELIKRGAIVGGTKQPTRVQPQCTCW